jgi:CheY-like chemotaxis protein
VSHCQIILCLDKDGDVAQKSLADDHALVVVASTLEQLHYYLAASTCDTFLCDLSLPELDFHAATDQLRQRNPAARIILTGPAHLESAARALMQNGSAHDFISKPWHLINLRQMVFRTPAPQSDEASRPTPPPPPVGQTGLIFGAVRNPARITAPILETSDLAPANQPFQTRQIASVSKTGQIPGAAKTGQILGAARTGQIPGAAKTGQILGAARTGQISGTARPGVTGRILGTGETAAPAKGKRTIFLRSTRPMTANKGKAGGLMPPPPPPATPEPPPLLQEPRYRLDKLLGAGGIGKVYLAHDLLLDTDVAVKILNPDFIHDDEVVQALKNEAKTCMQLTHPHIVRFYDFGLRGGTCILVMEYVPGHTLYETLKFPESRQPEYVRAVALTLGSALSYAHTHGVLHNDITPGNILVRPDGVLKLIDFGIATVAHQRRAKSDFVFGTPAYMSPEQLRCDPLLDATTDVFSMGVLLHQMLTGLLPQSDTATLEDLALQPRPPITRVAPHVAAVLDRALAFDPAHRWQSVRELVTAFDSAFNA